MPSSPEGRRPLWREPLLHFVLLALGILGAEQLLARPAGPAPVVLDDAFVAGLQAEARERGDAGDPVARWLAEEALFREALALGLDRGDPIVRRRLVQKMEFLLRSELAAGEPSEAELEALLARDRERYQPPLRVAFEHVFFDGERHADAPASARASLAGAGGSDPAGGDPFLLGSTFSLAPVSAHAARLGASFAEGLAEAPAGTWHGPVVSTYGAHLVRVTAREESTAPTVDAVRPALRAAWARETEETRLRAAIDALREGLPLDDRRTP